MEIFNIHLFEFLLIAGLALIVFGPERLPEMGRMVGKQVARFLAWQQQSPELRLINEVRTDIEQEIASLRDELVRTRKQLDLSQDVSQIREELRPLISLRDPQPTLEPALDPLSPELAAPVTESVGEVLATQASESVGEVLATQVSDATNAEALTQAAAATILPPPGPAGTVPAQRPERPVASTSSGVLNPIDDADAYLLERRALAKGVPLDQSLATPVALNGHQPPETPLSVAERDELVRQVQTLSAELQGLITSLRQRGIMVEPVAPTVDQPTQESMPR